MVHLHFRGSGRGPAGPTAQGAVIVPSVDTPALGTPRYHLQVPDHYLRILSILTILSFLMISNTFRLLRCFLWKRLISLNMFKWLK